MSSRRAGYVVAWVVAATLAVVVGIAAISQVGASIRGRGPLGNEVVRDIDRGTTTVRPDPGSPERRESITGEWGGFEVGCRGIAAYGRSVEPAEGWKIVSFERGPDDDVDAVFSNPRKGRSVEIEVICNQGVPTVDDLERNTLPEDEDD